MADRRKAEQTITELRKQLAEGGGSVGETAEINGITFERRILDNTPAKDLKFIADAKWDAVQIRCLNGFGSQFQELPVHCGLRIFRAG